MIRSGQFKNKDGKGRVGLSSSVQRAFHLENGGAKQQTMEFMDEHPVIRSILEYDQFFKQALAGG